MLGRTAISRAWLLLSATALVAGAGFALLVAAARTPGLGDALGLRELFAPALVLHVALATLVWLQAVMASVWSDRAADSRAQPGRDALRWAAWWVAVMGTVLILGAAIGRPQAILSNYVPVLAHPLFVVGLGAIAFAVALTGVLSLGAGSTGSGHSARADSGPARVASTLAVLPLLLAIGSALIAWRSGAQAVPWAARAEEIFWGAGHLLQFSYLLLAQAAWLWLMRDRVARPRLAMLGVVLTVAPALGGPVIHLMWALDSAQYRSAFTWLMQAGSWPGAALVVASLVRARHLRPDRVASLRRCWRDPVVGAWLSIALLAVGVLVALLIDGETTMVPAHYHGAVGASTLASIALALDARKGYPSAIPFVYAVGFALLIGGLALAGVVGTPRKLPDAAALSEQVVVRAAMLVMSLGALVAMAAIVAFGVRIAAWSIRSRASRLVDPAGAARAAGRHPTAAAAALRRATEDRRPRAIAVTIGSVAILTAALSWTGNEIPGAAPQRAAAQRANPLEAEVHQRFQQGVWMLHARRYEHALAAFHRVIEIDPRMPEAHVNIGFAMLGLGRNRQARDFFESSIELRREQLNAYYGLATALDAIDDLAGAIGAMRTYVHLARDDDPYLRKARAALWEWEARLQAQRRATR